tara:strand:+ start:4673 stop:5794 length:1122 start_codon:yes stop_codon:yes gene_type:complete
MEKLVNIRKIIRENVKRRILLEITLKTIEKDIEAASKLDVIGAKLKNRLNKHKANLIKRSQKKMRNKKRKARVGSAINSIQSITNPKKDAKTNVKQRTNGSKSTAATNAGTTASSETIKWKQYKKQTAWLYRLNTATNNWETKKVSTDKVFVLGHPDGETDLKQKKYLTTISLLNKAFVSDLDAAKIEKKKRYVHVKETTTAVKTKKTNKTKTSSSVSSEDVPGESENKETKKRYESVKFSEYKNKMTGVYRSYKGVTTVPISQVSTVNPPTVSNENIFKLTSDYTNSSINTYHTGNNKQTSNNYDLIVKKTGKTLPDPDNNGKNFEFVNLFIDGTGNYNYMIRDYVIVKDTTDNKVYFKPWYIVGDGRSVPR